MKDGDLCRSVIKLLNLNGKFSFCVSLVLLMFPFTVVVYAGACSSLGSRILLLSIFLQISVLGAEAAIFLPLSNRVGAQVKSRLICSFSLLSRFPCSAP
jgi:hypothetical protein